MKRRLIIGVSSISVIVFVFSMVLLLGKISDYNEGNEIYRSAKELSGIGDFLTGPESGAEDIAYYLPGFSEEGFSPINIDSLKKINSDVVGWIVVPGTGISYPLMDSNDNSYYLDHTWDNTVNSVGAIFLEEKNSSGLEDFNTIIFGHNMMNGSMFGCLKNYKNQEFIEEAPHVYIFTEDKVRRYDIFASFEAGVKSFVFRPGIQSETKKREYIEKSVSMSEISSDTDPYGSEHFLTLSTCTGNGYKKRRVVQAVLTETAVINNSSNSN
ncbi:MAG: class B sortase [Bacillota bacterium]|nr:class B sortase [Bacillota bacterium]